MPRGAQESMLGTMASSGDPPRVSVICIFRDEARFIEEAIASVCAQDFRDFELLLVDDGSRDESARIALRTAEDGGVGARLLRHPGGINRGMSASRNLALGQAKGEFIAFIDADDRWRPHKLSEQLVLIGECAAAGMVCGQVNYWHSWNGGRDRLVPTGQLTGGRLDPPEAALRLYPLGHADAPCPSDALLRREMVQRLGGFEPAFTGLFEDQVLFVKLYLEAPVLFSGKVWLDYRQHERSSVSRAWREGEYARWRLAFLDWFDGYLARWDGTGKDALASASQRARLFARNPALHRAARAGGRLLARLRGWPAIGRAGGG